MKLSVVVEYFDQATAPMKRTEQSFKSLGKSVNLVQNCLRKTNQVAELFRSAGDVIEQWMQPGVEFGQSMADLSSITGIAGTDLERLAKIARETGISSGFGAKNAADAFALLASQIDVSKIGMDGLIELQSKTITLAQASGISMTEAANSMAGVMNQFGLQADQAGRIINVLAAGSKYGAAEIPQLAESFKVVGTTANTAGLSIESTAGAIEVLSKNNLKGAEAGSALRDILLKMQTAMGVDFSKTSLQEALIKLKPHLKDAAYMSNLFGMGNVAAAQFLVANTDLLGEMTERITDTNVAQEQAAIRTDTWSQRLKEQNARFNDWMITAQKDFGGVMYAFQLAGQSLDMFLSLAPLGKLLSEIGTGAWNAGLGIIKFGRTLKTLALAKNTGSTFAFARAVVSCGRMGRIAAGLLNGYQKAVTFCSLILKRATGSQIVHNIAVKAAALGTNICAKANLVASSVMSILNKMTKTATWTELRKAAATKLHTLRTLMSSKAMLVAKSVIAGLTKVTKVAAFVQGGLTKAFRVAKMVMMTSVLPALGGVISATWAWTAALLANPITWIVLAVGALVAAIVICWQKFAGFRAVVLTIWDTIKGFGIAIFNYMVTPLKVVWKILSGLGKAIFKLFTGDFKGAAEEFTGAFKDGFQEGVEGFKKSVNGIKDTVSGISGNYEMHLSEEQAKQAKKEKEKKEKKQQKGEVPKVVTSNGKATEIQENRPEKVQTSNTPEVAVVHVENTQKTTLSERPVAEQLLYGNVPEVVTSTGEATEVQENRQEKVQTSNTPEVPVVHVANTQKASLSERPVAEQLLYGNVPEVVTSTGKATEVQENRPEKVQNSNMPVVNVENTQESALLEMSVVEQMLYGDIPEVEISTGKAAEVQVFQPEKVQDSNMPEMLTVDVDNTQESALLEMSVVEQMLYGDIPDVVTSTGETAEVQVFRPEKFQDSSIPETSVVNVGKAEKISIPEVKTVVPPINFNSLFPAGGQTPDHNLTNNYNRAANNNTENQTAKVEIKFQPNINISAELTQKTREDFLDILRGFGDEITRMVEEVQRRNGRGAYAIS